MFQQLARRTLPSSALGIGLGAAGSFWLAQPKRQATTQCCGIVGYIGPNDVVPILIDGVKILQNRGYDSCGIATLNANGEIVTTKHASKGTTSDCVDVLAKESSERHSGHRIGIAHTRWATHGAKTDANAHPHSDWLHRVSLVHNGTIENYVELKNELKKVAPDVTFRSETDTEVIANLIGYELGLGKSLERAVTACVESLQGTWGLVVIQEGDPQHMVCARNGSPLLVGTTENEVFVASETSALAQHTNHFVSLRDGEICVVSRSGIHGLNGSRVVQKIPKEIVAMSPDPFPHWTLKEISEQPESLLRALNYGGRIHPEGCRAKLGGLDCNREALLTISHLLLAACGTSLYASMYGEKLMQYLRCFESVRAVDASELDEAMLPKKHGGLMLLSQSGETLDTIKACQVGEAHGLRLMSVVNVVGSLLARMTGCGVYLNAGREVAVASTKAFTSQVLVLTLVATWFSQNKELSTGDSANIHEGSTFDRSKAVVEAVQRLPLYAMGLNSCREKCKEIALKFKDSRTIFILGKGFSYPVALEAALKIKEICYVHAEGFAGGALKHGPFALLDEAERTPVFLIVPTDEHTALMKIAAEQVKARGGRVVAIVDDPAAMGGLAEDLVVVPSNGPLTAMLAVIPLQYIAYEMAIARGINPDKPRGLAKTVTVS